MLLCVHVSSPTVVAATHTDLQLAEIEAAYPATDFQIVRVSEHLELDSPVPAEAEIVRPFATPAA